MNTPVSPVNILFRLMNEQDKIIQCENWVFSTKRGYVLLWQFLVEINFKALQIYNWILWSNCRHRVLKLTEDISGLCPFVSFIFGLDLYFISRITNSLLNTIRCEKRILRYLFCCWTNNFYSLTSNTLWVIRWYMNSWFWYLLISKR